MNASVPKYVTQSRAAMLLGILFTYEELRKICLMTVHQVH